MATYKSSHTGVQVDNAVDQVLNKTEKVIWGNVEGTITNQTDLQEALSAVESKIPTNNSQLENGAGYATESYVDEKLTGVENLLKSV